MTTNYREIEAKKVKVNYEKDFYCLVVPTGNGIKRETCGNTKKEALEMYLYLMQGDIDNLLPYDEARADLIEKIETGLQAKDWFNYPHFQKYAMEM